MKFLAPISDELEQVELHIHKEINSDLPLLNEMACHLLDAGGKRLRPAFFLLSAKMFKSDLKSFLPLAAAIEMVHMATLIHDDLIDNSEFRRGVATVKREYGNRMSVYTGNYLFARSLGLAVQHGKPEIMEKLSRASMQICSGELEQLDNAYNVEQKIGTYLRRIRRKTALLFALSCEMGAYLSEATPQAVKALRKYGHYTGLAFQVSDDILDLTGEASVMGKPAGADIEQGNFNLAVIFALEHSDKKERLRELLSNPVTCNTHIKEILRIVHRAHGIEFAHYVCRRFINKALAALEELPDSEARHSLLRIAQEIPRRKY